MSTLSRSRILKQLKRSVMHRVQTQGEVSAKDIKNVMRSSTSGPERGGLVARVFRDLVIEGKLQHSGFKILNPATGHRVVVYQSAV